MATDTRPWKKGRLMRQGALKGQTFYSQKEYEEARSKAKAKKEAAEQMREQRAARDKPAAKIAARGKASAAKRSHQRSK